MNEDRPMPPLIAFAGALGGLAVVRWAYRTAVRVNRELEEARLARVQSGCVLEAVDKGLNEAGFILGHDPWTVPVATIGGAISTNSVGYRAGIYGSMGDQVLGRSIEVDARSLRDILDGDLGVRHTKAKIAARRPALGR